MMYFKDAERIRRGVDVIERAKSVKHDMNVTKEEEMKAVKNNDDVAKEEKMKANEHTHVKAKSPEDLITQTRTIYDVEMVDHKLWCEDGLLYMSLRYKVATDVGDVDLLYPKISMPFAVDDLPVLKMFDDRHGHQVVLHAGIGIFNLYDTEHPDYPSLGKAYVFEHMDEPPEREMTIAEIEKELGYKVKVVGGPYDKREN